jgi:hypothetical protein
VTWQAQLSGTIDTSLAVEMFYLDADLVPAPARAVLHDAGRGIACYLSAGSFEPWRQDAADFPPETIGNALPDYPREQWLDIRSAAVRAIIERRIDALAAASCDAVVPANLEAHLSDSGFPIGIADERSYGTWLASTIHLRGMSAGLSSSDDLVSDLAPGFDWALAFSCLPDICPGYGAVRRTGMTVLSVEYGDASSAAATCAQAQALGFDTIIKHLALDSFRIACGGG